MPLKFHYFSLKSKKKILIPKKYHFFNLYPTSHLPKPLLHHRRNSNSKSATPSHSPRLIDKRTKVKSRPRYAYLFSSSKGTARIHYRRTTQQITDTTKTEGEKKDRKEKTQPFHLAAFTAARVLSLEHVDSALVQFSPHFALPADRRPFNLHLRQAKNQLMDTSLFRLVLLLMRTKLHALVSIRFQIRVCTRLISHSVAVVDLINRLSSLDRRKIGFVWTLN